MLSFKAVAECKQRYASGRPSGEVTGLFCVLEGKPSPEGLLSREAARLLVSLGIWNVVKLALQRSNFHGKVDVFKLKNETNGRNEEAMSDATASASAALQTQVTAGFPSPAGSAAILALADALQAGAQAYALSTSARRIGILYTEVNPQVLLAMGANIRVETIAARLERGLCGKPIPG